MVIRVIYAPLTGAKSDGLVLAAAGAAARQFGAHADVVFQCADPRAAIPYLGEGISGDTVARFVESAALENAELVRRAHAQFDAWRDRAGLTLADTPAKTDNATCSWRESEAMNAGDAGLADLVIAAQGDSETDSESGFESLLMHGGRPVLLMRSPAGAKLGKRVLIAWNGRAEAARAVAAAMPFLQDAQSVAAITVPESSVPAGALGADLARYLGWHGIALDIAVVAEDSGPVGECLLNEAARRDADLLVMGAYGHSRLREYILGGATRHILDEGTIPVLMTH